MLGKSELHHRGGLEGEWRTGDVIPSEISDREKFKREGGIIDDQTSFYG